MCAMRRSLSDETTEGKKHIARHSQLANYENPLESNLFILNFHIWNFVAGHNQPFRTVRCWRVGASIAKLDLRHTTAFRALL